MATINIEKIQNEDDWENCDGCNALNGQYDVSIGDELDAIVLCPDCLKALGKAIDEQLAV